MEILKKRKIDDYFSVDHLYAFTKENSNYVFLLGKNGCSIVVDKYLFDIIKNKDIPEYLKFKLLSHGLATLKEPKIKVPTIKDKTIYFVIDVTKKCNFDCVYCFRNLNDKRIISEERLKDICHYILNIVKARKLKNVKVQVWGGEPLLAFSKIEYIYNFFKDTDVPLNIDIETNGSLITDKLAKKLFDMKVNVGISIDGLKNHQDIQRRLISNESSHNLVKKGINNLQKYYGNHLGIITVITKYNYQDIDKIIKYFVNDLKLINMKFNIVRDNPNANEKSIGLSLEEVKWFANKLFDTIEKYHQKGLSFYEGNIQTRINNLNERLNHNYCNSNGCKGGTNLVSIDMFGDIYPCEMMDYPEVKIGSIYQDNKLTNNHDLLKNIKESKKHNIYFKKKINPECHKCPWEYFCKGGCSSRVVYSNGLMKYDEVECEFNKVIYERIIDKILRC